MEITSDIMIDRAKINPLILKKVEKVEHEEQYTAILSFQTFNHTIWLLNVQFVQNKGNAIAFQSLNLYEKGTNSYVFNMQDGKVYGFDICNITNTYSSVIDTPEAFIGMILHDLFVEGWD